VNTTVPANNPAGGVFPETSFEEHAAYLRLSRYPRHMSAMDVMQPQRAVPGTPGAYSPNGGLILLSE
jgi:hypothetical protein